MKKIKKFLFLPLLFFAFNPAYSGNEIDTVTTVIKELGNRFDELTSKVEEEFSNKIAVIVLRCEPESIKKMIEVLRKLKSGQEVAEGVISSLKEMEEDPRNKDAIEGIINKFKEENTNSEILELIIAVLEQSVAVGELS